MEDSPSDTARVFSMGYEGKSINSFIDMLRQNGVERLIDVRETPFSRKPGFSKKALESELLSAGIGYFSIPEMGTDKRSRERYRGDGRIDLLLEDYKSRFQANKERYEYLKSLALGGTSGIMCLEEDSAQCHRQVIEKELERDGFRVIPLTDGKRKKD